MKDRIKLAGLCFIRYLTTKAIWTLSSLTQKMDILQVPRAEDNSGSLTADVTLLLYILCSQNKGYERNNMYLIIGTLIPPIHGIPPSFTTHCFTHTKIKKRIKYEGLCYIRSLSSKVFGWKKILFGYQELMKMRDSLISDITLYRHIILFVLSSQMKMI